MKISSAALLAILILLVQPAISQEIHPLVELSRPNAVGSCDTGLKMPSDPWPHHFTTWAGSTSAFKYALRRSGNSNLANDFVFVGCWLCCCHVCLRCVVF
jgi:hypothetical protein